MFPIPPRLGASLLGLALVLLALHSIGSRLRAEGYAKCQAEHEKALATANARSQAETFARQSLQADIDRSTNVQVLRDRISADAVRVPAGRVFDSLAAGCSSAVPSDPAASSVTSSASDAARVRSVVLGEIRERLGALARTADERGTAGLGTERAYDSLRP